MACIDAYMMLPAIALFTAVRVFTRLLRGFATMPPAAQYFEMTRWLQGRDG